MPYVALPASDRASRVAGALARWDDLTARQPELEPVVALQQKLIAAIEDAAETIERGKLPRLSLPPRYVAAKLARGVPALAREPIPIPVNALEPALRRLCVELGQGGWGDVADRLHTILTDRELDAASLLAMSLSRDQHAVRAVAAHHGLSPDLVWLVSELAVSPYAHALQRTVFSSSADGALASALRRVASRLLPALRLVAGGRRSGFAPKALTLLVLRARLGTARSGLYLLRRVRRAVRQKRNA